MRFLGLAAWTLFGACSAGQGGSDVSRQDNAAQMFAQWQDANFSNPATLPTAGHARYEGFLALNLPTGADATKESFVGDLSIGVDFGASDNALSGQATSFVADEVTLEGTLTIGGGQVDRGTDTTQDFTFSANLGGTLVGAYDFAVDAYLVGDFRARHQDGMDGVVYGSVTASGDQYIIDGEFVASRE